MRSSRRSFTLNPQLELVEARVVPSAMGVKLAAHAHAVAVAEARHEHLMAERAAALAHAKAVHAAAVARAEGLRTLVAAHPAATAVATSHAPSVGSSVSSSSHTAAVVNAPVHAVPSATVTPTVATNHLNTTSPSTTQTSATTTTTTTNIGDVKNGPLAKAGQDLINLYLAYQSYVQGGSSGTFSSSASARLEVVGTSVRVDIRGSVDAATLASTLSGMGMQVTSTDASTRTVEGLLPIAQLPNVAPLSQVVTISPVYKPMLL